MSTYKISNWYMKKSPTERKLEILKTIVKLEAMLKSSSFSISSCEGSIGVEQNDDSMNELRLLPELSAEFHVNILEIVNKYKIELQKLGI